MKILLVQTSFLGDVILSTPLIQNLHNFYPGAELWLMTTPLGKSLVERDPLVSGVVVFDKRGRNAGVGGLRRMAAELKSMNFDAVYSLHRSIRTSILLWLAGIPRRVGFCEAKGAWLYAERSSRKGYAHEVERNLALLSREKPVEELSSDLRLYAPPREEWSEEVKEFLDAKKPYVLLVPGSSWHTKQWDVKGYREVAQYYLSRGCEIVLTGAPHEANIASAVTSGLTVKNFVGRIGLGDTMALVQHARLVVCNDSMVLHLASGFHVPCVAVFCATSPSFGFGPWQNEAVVVEAEGLECKPCSRHGGKRCPTATERCMREVASQRVIEASEGLIEL